ncbi:hypothetical protein AB0G79_32795 [Streptomyces sp. NPDC020807]|uniref:hypothetical protein n=1 Tax=Streptomyces sp. NPDC020807 TaxID=3155119 RepID=UPI003409DB9C
MTHLASARPPRVPERQGPLTFGQLARLVEHEDVLARAPAGRRGAERRGAGDGTADTADSVNDSGRLTKEQG